MNKNEYYDIQHDGINGSHGFQMVMRNTDNNDYVIISAQLTERDAEIMIDDME